MGKQSREVSMMDITFNNKSIFHFQCVRWYVCVYECVHVCVCIYVCVCTLNVCVHTCGDLRLVLVYHSQARIHFIP